jgi:hypothetical protein
MKRLFLSVAIAVVILAWIKQPNSVKEPEARYIIDPSKEGLSRVSDDVVCGTRVPKEPF